MTTKPTSRRQFLLDTLKLAGASAVTSLLPESILKAQSIPPASSSYSINDVQHIVILMQENRSFDHYFGMLAGVRGFGDPRPVILPSGYPVWYQNQASSSSYVLPYHPGSGPQGDTYFSDLAHDWTTTHQAWDGGLYDAWVPNKSAATMAHFTSVDIPYYYALAQAFTICDNYHCSQLGPTNPNRIYLWTGCCGNVAGSSPQNGNGVSAYNWKTFPELLAAAGVTWKVYQDKGQGLDTDSGVGEYESGTTTDLWWNGNYGDNALLNFPQYQNLGASSPLSPALNGTQIAATGNAKPYDLGLFSQLQSDVANNTLPQVSWIVAPYAYCEHPSWAASGGEWYVDQVLQALTSNPAVWASTVLFVTYDENDGYFDHVPPPVPPASTNGVSNVSTANEFYNNGVASDGTAPTDALNPVGLGPRVPMIVVSPWSIGGNVNSQVFDHTSVIQFIERRFGTSTQPITETNITSWRRAVCGDLTSAFDFAGPASQSGFTIAPAVSNMNPGGPTVQLPGPPSPQALPTQAVAMQPACQLPYEFFVAGRINSQGTTLTLQCANTGQAGVSLQLRHYAPPGTTPAMPRVYTIGASVGGVAGTVQDVLPIGSNGSYDFSIYGPNGFLREFRGNLIAPGSSGPAPEVETCYNVEDASIQITLDNSLGTQPCTFVVTDNAYQTNKSVTVSVGAGMTQAIVWPGCYGWHDASIRIAGDVNYFRRIAGCVQAQTGPWKTDPAIGNAALFGPALSIQGATYATLRFDYVAPPWNHSPKNWIGVYAKGATPGSVNSLQWVYAPRNAGSVLLSTYGGTALPSGQYDVWYLFDDGYTTLAGPLSLTI